MLNERKTRKFDSEYVGPYPIVEMLDNGNELLYRKNRTRVVHSNRFRKAYYGEPGWPLSCFADKFQNFGHTRPGSLRQLPRQLRL
ncbi:hypothetical protein ALC56_01236 [Trachymyrmex septentrionalis]|uniref:Uncharacterized protein n=1 Tax=Trachymyrmex septentrionalis TaxID=34720 RepID=A0A151K0Q8_9HYME|nr:hypothetical protein ALC56_01236 [Trachymyrmex septentrionalis]